MTPRWLQTAAVLNDVEDERDRQVARFGEQSHPDGTDECFSVMADIARQAADSADRAGCLTWLDILREETEEAAAETDPDKLRAELVQVAAVCVAWIEDLDRRKKASA